MLKTLAKPLNRCQCSSALHPRSFHTTPLRNIKDYYQILDLPRNATSQQIKSAYYDKAKTHHPDTKQSDSSSKKFQEISEAYQVLSDTEKRRVYDSTTSPYSSRPPPRSPFSPIDEEGSRPRTRVDTMSMNHIHHVYKTLNKDPVEEPKFRPFEDHMYPGTPFNRFVYTRVWDSKSKSWVYTKRKTANKYFDSMKSKTKILTTCVMVFMLGTLCFLLNYSFVFPSLTSQSKRHLNRNQAGMYIVMEGGDVQLMKESSK